MTSGFFIAWDVFLFFGNIAMIAGGALGKGVRLTY